MLNIIKKNHFCCSKKKKSLLIILTNYSEILENAWRKEQKTPVVILLLFIRFVVW